MKEAPITKLLMIDDKQIEYSLRPSRKARALRLSVYPDKRIVVSASLGYSISTIENFIKSKSEWILDKLRYFSKFAEVTTLRGGRREYLKYKEVARSIVHERLRHFNQFYNFDYGNITIRNQKSRWGSCSKRGNLNFNFKIAQIDAELADYIIVHELCHTKEFNHGKAFWQLVEKTIPNYKDLRGRLKRGALVTAQ